MASVRLPSYALAALALIAGGGSAHAQVVQVFGTFSGVPYPPTCAPPAGDNINFVLTTPAPQRLQAGFACDTVPTRPLRFTCLPTEIGGSGTGVSVAYDVRPTSGGTSALFIECPTDSSTVVTNLEVAILDLFADRATYQANPGADAPEFSCLSNVGQSITRVSYSPDTRILSLDCLSGTATTTVQCFTFDGVQVSSPRSTNGLGYQASNRNTLNVEDCIGFGSNNDRAFNSPALIPPAVVGDLLFADSFEPPASVSTTTAITGIVPSPATIGEPYTVSVSVTAAAGKAGGAVLVSDAVGANCTVALSAAGSGSCALTSNTAGTRTVRATYAGRVGFDGSTVTAAQSVGIGSQTISFSSPAEGASVVYSAAGSVPLVATGGNSGNPVVFTTTTPATCGVTGSTLNLGGAGACTIRANQAGNANYTAAPQVTRNITIAKAAQAIVFPDPGPKPFGATFQIAATGGGSGNPVVFSSTNNARCTVSGTTVTPVAVNTCTIRAQQGGNANYDPAPQVLRDITIVRGVGSLTFPAQGPRSLAAGVFALSFTPGPSTAQVTFVSLSPSVCTVTGASSVVPLSTGTCEISGTHEADAFYDASPTIDRDITINP